MVDDKFGAKKIYPTKAGGQEWFLSDDPDSDSRFKPDGSVNGNANDGFSVSDNGQIRHGVYTTSGYNEGNTTEDHAKAASRGYMQMPMIGVMSRLQVIFSTKIHRQATSMFGFAEAGVTRIQNPGAGVAHTNVT